MLPINFQCCLIMDLSIAVAGRSYSVSHQAEFHKLDSCSLYPIGLPKQLADHH